MRKGKIANLEKSLEISSVKKSTMSNNTAMTKSPLNEPLKLKNMVDLLKVEDQIRVDDDMLTAELPDRRSNRNSTVYNPTPKASLPGRLTSRNRTIFMKDD